MLKQYSNKEQILDAPKSIEARRFTEADNNTFQRNPKSFLIDNSLIDTEFQLRIHQNIKMMMVLLYI